MQIWVSQSNTLHEEQSCSPTSEKQVWQKPENIVRKTGTKLYSDLHFGLTPRRLQAKRKSLATAWKELGRAFREGLGTVRMESPVTGASFHSDHRVTRLSGGRKKGRAPGASAGVCHLGAKKAGRGGQPGMAGDPSLHRPHSGNDTQASVPSVVSGKGRAGEMYVDGSCPLGFSRFHKLLLYAPSS